MCDGASADEVLSEIHRKVTLHGWAIQGVSGDPPDGDDWVYTIGLVEYGHPELVVVGVGMVPAGARILDQLGEGISSNLRFTPGDEVTLPAGRVRFGAVDPNHIERGLVNMWANYYADRGGTPPQLEVVQVIPPPLDCSCGLTHASPLLSDPSVRVGKASRRRPMDHLPSYRPRSAAARRRRKR